MKPYLVMLHTLVCSLTLLACAGPLRDELASDDDDNENEPARGRVTITQESDGSFSAEVDASSEVEWVYFDLETAREVFPRDPEDSPDWDLAFQRFRIKSNGGISGSGGVSVAILKDTDFDDVSEAPETGYLEDAEDGDDDNPDPDFVFLLEDGWYTYDLGEHVLGSRDVVYIVRTVEAGYFKVRVTGYYDDAGSPGYPQFRFERIDGPPGTLFIDASDRESWVYMKLPDEFVEVSEPEDSGEWDLAFQRAYLRTNSGTSGTGLGGVRLENGAYDEASESPTFGFMVDEPLMRPESELEIAVSSNPAFNEWYDYVLEGHVVTPKDVFFFVRGATGDYAKLRIEYWKNGRFSLRLAMVERSQAVQTTTLDASDEDTFTYFSFRQGDVVQVEDESHDSTWDLALSRTILKTNSGTSGSGVGGAVEAPDAALDAVEQVPDKGFESDTVDETPEGDDISTNPVLAGWFEQPSSDDPVMARDTAYVLRTADGGYAKFKITSYDAGIYELCWVYAGAGRDEF